MIKTSKFTIVSNNCWGGKVYRYFHLPYLSPTVGLYFFAEDYLKFCTEFSRYINENLTFISIEDSRYNLELTRKGERNVIIGKLDDIEIIFLHYHSEYEAKEKWERRKRRIQYDNLYFKFSEQNGCTKSHLKKFTDLPLPNKIIFTTRDYKLPNQIVFKNSVKGQEIIDETLGFKYVSPIKYIRGQYF